MTINEWLLPLSTHRQTNQFQMLHYSLTISLSKVDCKSKEKYLQMI